MPAEIDTSFIDQFNKNKQAKTDAATRRLADAINSKLSTNSKLTLKRSNKSMARAARIAKDNELKGQQYRDGKRDSK